MALASLVSFASAAWIVEKKWNTVADCGVASSTAAAPDSETFYVLDACTLEQAEGTFAFLGIRGLTYSLSGTGAAAVITVKEFDDTVCTASTAFTRRTPTIDTCVQGDIGTTSFLASQSNGIASRAAAAFTWKHYKGVTTADCSGVAADPTGGELDIPLNECVAAHPLARAAYFEKEWYTFSKDTTTTPPVVYETRYNDAACTAESSMVKQSPDGVCTSMGTVPAWRQNPISAYSYAQTFSSIPTSTPAQAPVTAPGAAPASGDTLAPSTTITSDSTAGTTASSDDSDDSTTMETVKFAILIANSAFIALLFLALIVFAVLVLIALRKVSSKNNASGSAAPPPSELELSPPPGDSTVGPFEHVAHYKGVQPGEVLIMTRAAAIDPSDPIKLSKARATAGRERRLSNREARRAEGADGELRISHDKRRRASIARSEERKEKKEAARQARRKSIGWAQDD